MTEKAEKLSVPANRAGRFDHIDGLRAFAVLLVVIMHTGYTFVPGDSGVTVFFGISGFIITYIVLLEHAKTGSFNIRRFYFRRAFKLFPPFLAAIMLPTMIYTLFRPVNVDAFLGQLFFVYNWMEIYSANWNEVLPGSVVVWSLAVEEQFYIAFSAIWIVLVRTAWWRQGLITLSVISILGSMLARVFLSQDGQFIRVLRGTDTRLDAIAWGVLAAVLIHMWQRGEANWISFFGKDLVLLGALAMFLGGMALRDGWVEYAFRPTVQAIAGVLVIIYGMVPSNTLLKKFFYRGMAWAPIQLMGLASYSIYLTHYPVEKLMSVLLVDLPLPAFAALAAAAGIGSGLLLYRFVERPALRLRKSLEARPRESMVASRHR